MKKEMAVLVAVAVIAVVSFFALLICLSADADTVIEISITDETFKFIAIGEGEHIAIGKLNNVIIDARQPVRDVLIFQDRNEEQDIYVLNAGDWEWTSGEWYKVRIKAFATTKTRIVDAEIIVPVVRVVIPKG